MNMMVLSNVCWFLEYCSWWYDFFQVDVRWGISACELFYCYFFFCPCKEYQLNSQIHGAIFQINKEVMKILRLQHAKDKLSPRYDQTNNWNKFSLSPDCDVTVVKLLPGCLLSLGYSWNISNKINNSRYFITEVAMEWLYFRSVKKWVRLFSAYSREMFTDKVSLFLKPCSVRVTFCARGAKPFRQIKGAYLPLYISHLVN